MGLFVMQFLGPSQDPEEVQMQAAVYGWREFPTCYPPHGAAIRSSDWSPVFLFLFLVVLAHISFPRFRSHFGDGETSTKDKK